MDGFEGPDIELLGGNWFELPRPWPGGSLTDFASFLKQQYAMFNCTLQCFQGQLAAHLVERQEQRLTLENAVLAALNALAEGDANRSVALGMVSQGLDATRPEIDYISKCNDRILGPQVDSLYRLRTWNDQTGRKPGPQDLFHVPFHLQDRVQPARFSLRNAPCLYLGNSIGLCWIECREPDFAKCYVSRFELAEPARKVLDLSCSPRQIMSDFSAPPSLAMAMGENYQLSKLMNSPYGDDPCRYIASYLTLWPLMAASMIRRGEPRDPQPEYSIPQLLMSWAQQSDNDYCGVRFFSTLDETSTNSNDYPVNYAFPARESSDGNYCGFLTKHLKLTEPVKCGPGSLPDDRELRKRAVDRRGARHGRCMMRSQDYYSTEYCYWEYMLDTMHAETLRT
jgi:hypothetical protein